MKQGKTIDDEYNVFDGDKMSYENIQTALTRCTDWRKIRIDKYLDVYKSEYDNFRDIKCFNKNKKAVIYKNECLETGFIYIGQTGRNETIRGKEHFRGDGVGNKNMKKPIISKIGYVYGSQKYIVYR